MSVRNGIALLLTLSALTFLVACGSNSSPRPNPAGFSTGSLNGTYVFSSSGSDASGFFLTMTGTLAANGSGGITAGTVDIIGQEVTPSSPVAQPISSGSYRVGPDGRGQVSFTVTGIPITLDFVLTSSSHGLVTEFDGNGTGSGTIDLQSAVTQGQLAGSYAFGLSGTGAGTGGVSLLAVGAMTLGSNGSVTTGLEDINNNGVAESSSLATSSFVNLGSAPGTALIANSTAGASFSFDVYPIDSTHLKFIETDGLALLSGDAYTQGTSIPSGQLVYTMAGEDLSSLAPLAVGGWLTNTSGTITPALEDYNDGGNVVLGFSVTGGNFTALSGGRSVLTLNGFVNGANSLAGNYTFAAYPFTFSGGSGIQLLEIDNAGVTSGAAYPQTPGATLAAANYGMNLRGFNSAGEEDDIAQFAATSNGFSGAVDQNDDTQSLGQTTQNFDQALTTAANGYTAPDGNGRGAEVTNFFSFAFYAVNSSTYILLETDTTQVGLGTFELQSTPGAGAAAQPAVSMLRPAVRAHAVRQKKK